MTEDSPDDLILGRKLPSGHIVQNIYQMYAANGYRCGFTVRRDSWGNASHAIIRSIDGEESGPLEGTPPYYKSPKVIADICYSGKWSYGQILSSPGTYAYKRIDEDPLFA